MNRAPTSEFGNRHARVHGPNEPVHAGRHTHESGGCLNPENSPRLAMYSLFRRLEFPTHEKLPARTNPN